MTKRTRGLTGLPSMYVPYEERRRLIGELASLDLVTRPQVEAAVSGYALVSARVEAVATIVANLNEEFRGVEEYEWHMQGFRISLSGDARVPGGDMGHLHNIAVTASLFASRKGEGDEHEDRIGSMGSSGHISYDDGRGEIITRSVQFPIRYLTTDDWLEEAQRKAKRDRLWWLKRHDEGADAAVAKRQREVDDLREKVAANRAQIAAIEAEGITVDDEVE